MDDGLTDLNLSAIREDEEEVEVEEKRETGDEEGERRNQGGILDNLIQNLVSPLSPKPKPAVVDEEVIENERSKRPKTEKDHVGSDETASGNGGLIKNVISNFFQTGEAQAAENGNKDEKEQQEEGGGIIENIVSHLPKSLTDDKAAPTTDEASILIHSIIHD